MSTRVLVTVLAAFLLCGCEGAMEKQRQIEEQRLAAQVQLAQIQAASNERIAAVQAEEERKAAEHRTDRIIELLRFLLFVAAPVVALGLFLAHRARITHLQLAAAVEISRGLTHQQQSAVVNGLLAAGGVNSKTLTLLEHHRR